MKIQTLLFSIAALCAISLFSACGNDSAAAKDAGAENAGTQAGADGQLIAPTADAPADAMQPLPGAPTIVPPTDAKPAEPAQNATGVWHYTCAKGCAGGAGSATACAKCGATLVHNTTYHGTPSPAATTVTPSGAPTQPTITPPTAKPEPAQNKTGVWHYTCPDGCAGGGGSATACAKCGKTLTHNTAYHQ